jgi:hypothetical protein
MCSAGAVACGPASEPDDAVISALLVANAVGPIGLARVAAGGPGATAGGGSRFGTVAAAPAHAFVRAADKVAC